jgi:hypothetical protein
MFDPIFSARRSLLLATVLSFAAVSFAAVGCQLTSEGGTGGDGGSGGDLSAHSSSSGSSTDGSSSSSSGSGGSGDCSPYVQSVISISYGPGAGFGQSKMPGIIEGPPKGGGANQGSLDVLTLGNGGEIVLGFGENTIIDGPGLDFIVFENAFDVGGDPTDPYSEIATVAVSEDGETWTEFPCTATAYPYGSCAGWHPVYANPSDNQIDPTDPKTAGGDAFDLADIGVTKARFVRITDRADVPSTFDLDAVSLVHATCDAP